MAMARGSLSRSWTPRTSRGIPGERDAQGIMTPGIGALGVMGMRFSLSPAGELSCELTPSDLWLYPPSLDGGLSGESTLSTLTGGGNPRLGALFLWS
jgi:hypothetical protein